MPCGCTMIRPELLELDFFWWVTWAAVAAGAAASGLVFLAGRQLIHRYWPSPTAVPADPAEAHVPAFGRERRRCPRRPVKPVQVLVLEPARAEPAPAVVVNRAEG